MESYNIVNVPISTNHMNLDGPGVVLIGSDQESFTTYSSDSDKVDFFFKYISEMLMDEDYETKPDRLALQAAEESLYDTLYGQKTYPNNSVDPFFVKNEPKGRKYFERDQEERSNKISAPSSFLDNELPEVFDAVLLIDSDNANHVSKNVQVKNRPDVGSSSSSRRKKNNTRARKQGRDLIDLMGLLLRCAQAVCSCDHMKSNELLSLIRQHSSPLGDANQRTAHYFANALELRLVGNSSPVHSHVVSSKTPAADGIKGYKAYITVCPFRFISNSYTNRIIAKLAEKATRVHIIDFGIMYGFQWPDLFQRLSTRPGGPPIVHITGIDFPQPGFKPALRVEQTGERLKSYCKRFNIPFEYSAIAKQWDTIRLDDFKLKKDEIRVVNCLFRFKSLPDDSMSTTSPRDSVLKLIKNLNPDLFVHGVINGTFNGPFFTTRFKEALYYYSTLFDIFESTLEREDEGRIMFEREVLGRDALNVIACEGAERMERPETYKQWQSRNLRIGFRKVKLDEDIVKHMQDVVKSRYHREFVISEDGNWMLQGWKGRTVSALSCWKPEGNS
ncbi:hypothetical protein ACFE04_012381 [Oxalis oulophora]